MPPPLSERNPQLDPRLDAVFARALAKRASDRYAKAADFVAALQQGETQEATEVLVRPARGPAIRSALLWGGAALLLAGGVATLAWRSPAWSVKAGKLNSLTLTPAGLLELETNGSVSLLDPRDGAPRWQARLLGAPLGPPALAGELVLAASEKEVQAWRLSDGQKAWSRPSEDGLAGLGVGFDNTVYAVESESLSALDVATGKPAWTQSVPGEQSLPPCVGPGAIYLASGKEVRALSLPDHATLWHKPLTDPQSMALSTEQGLLLVTSTEWVLKAYTALRGAEQYAADLPGTPVGLAVAQGTAVIACHEGPVLGLRVSDGTVLWQNPGKGTLDAAPVIEGAVAWLAGPDKTLRQLDLKSGQELSHWQLPAAAYLAPALGPERLFVASQGHLSALQR